MGVEGENSELPRALRNCPAFWATFSRSHIQWQTHRLQLARYLDKSLPLQYFTQATLRIEKYSEDQRQGQECVGAQLRGDVGAAGWTQFVLREGLR